MANELQLVLIRSLFFGHSNLSFHVLDLPLFSSKPSGLFADVFGAGGADGILIADDWLRYNRQGGNHRVEEVRRSTFVFAIILPRWAVSISLSSEAPLLTLMTNG